MTPHRSACPYDCPDTCGLLVDVAEGRAVAVRGDPDHPHSRGTLCPKMARYQDTVHSPLRLTSPLLAAGPKGSGAFTPISWEEAIRRIADRWREIIAAHGAQAILPYSYAGTMGLVQRNAGHPFFHRLGASRLDRTICTPAKGAGWAAVLGDTPALPPDTARHSDLVLIWGCNALATSLHGLNYAREARRAGAKVWLIDTYRTPTAAVCDRTFLVRPGGDGALALGIMHLLARDGRLDRDFIDEQVQGFPELAAQVLPHYPPARASALSGLPEAELEELAEGYGRARAPFILVGNGLSRYGNGAMNVRAIACLPALVGAWAREGGGAFASVTGGGGFNLGEVTREDFQAGPARLVNMNCLGHALEHLDGPPIMGLYVYHSNPAAVTPDQNAVLRGLSRPDLFTVVHERFLTDTARYADIVLPATSSLEHSDLYRSYGSYCIQRVRAAICAGGGEPQQLGRVPRPGRGHGLRRTVLPPERRRPHRPPAQPAQPGARRPGPGGPGGGPGGGAAPGPGRLAHALRAHRDPEPAPGSAPAPLPAPPRRRRSPAVLPHDRTVPVRPRTPPSRSGTPCGRARAA